MGTTKYKNTPNIVYVPSKRWTQDEVEYLRQTYPSGERQQIVEYLQKPWLAIRRKALELNISRNVAKTDVRLERLLDGSPVTFYWIGFLLADGNFVVEHNRLQVAVADYDEDHLLKFAQYINTEIRLKYCAGKPTPNSRDQYWLSTSNKYVMPLLVEKFGFTNKKTYVPPVIRNYGMSDENFMALLIGFIDGDGCIHQRKPPRSDVSGHITCHQSWLDNLLYLNQRLQKLLNKSYRNEPHLKGSGFATWSLNRTILRFLKAYALASDLPVMTRKWTLV